MKVSKDRFKGLEVYRVDHAPITGRSLRDHPDWIDDRWYYHEVDREWERLDSDGMTEASGREIVDVHAFVPMADGSNWEAVIIEEGLPDTAERLEGTTLFERVSWARRVAVEILAARAKG